MLVTATGELVYQVKTENSVTSVLRALPKKLGIDGEEQQFIVTGKIDWNRPITFQMGDNKPIPASAFLYMPYSDSKVKRFLGMAEENNKREFNRSTGTVYQWSFAHGEAKLRRKGIREPIAMYTWETINPLVKDGRASLIISNEGLEMLDLLILTWIQVALLMNTYRNKGLYVSPQTEWALATVGGDGGKDE
ncbi:hypothetical protein CALCODRAFT_482719 [Calocera cornea HHB12733]|uniref:DUF6593 domain-containing protein n=1 Tax=Calocera cornea HHB12733 TaxID=1353952 RepID=A0A165GG03_9BASI|nr:hypothetical protein CALCODRAFT_482719 [Calocera cornea HHB12733]